MRRTFWALLGIGIGVTVGVATVRWANRTKQRLKPQNMARGAASSGSAFADRLREAIEAGRVEMERKEAELRTELKLDS